MSFATSLQSYSSAEISIFFNVEIFISLIYSSQRSTVSPPYLQAAQFCLKAPAPTSELPSSSPDRQAFFFLTEPTSLSRALTSSCDQPWVLLVSPRAPLLQDAHSSLQAINTVLQTSAPLGLLQISSRPSNLLGGASSSSRLQILQAMPPRCLFSTQAAPFSPASSPLSHWGKRHRHLSIRLPPPLISSRQPCLISRRCVHSSSITATSSCSFSGVLHLSSSR